MRRPRYQIHFSPALRGHNIIDEIVQAAIADTFAATGLSYIDLFLIHSPYGGKEARLGSWRALVEAQQAGKIRSLGVSNYGVHHLDELESYIQSSSGSAGVISVGQWEVHPWLPRADIVSWCRSRGVVVQAYSPLVRGTRANEQALKDLAAKHGKTWAQILVRWSLQMGFVPLPKSEKEKRIEENAGVYGWELDEEDMKKLHFPESYAPCAWDPTVSND